MFCAKEAVLKAMELGITDVSLRDIEVLHKKRRSVRKTVRNTFWAWKAACQHYTYRGHGKCICRAGTGGRKMRTALTPAQMGAVDRFMMDRMKIPGLILMENAAHGVFEAIRERNTTVFRTGVLRYRKQRRGRILLSRVS